MGKPLVLAGLADPQLLPLLRTGAIGVLPTDTVYGLVAVAGNQAAVERLYALKPRERQPGTTIAASANQLATLGFPHSSLTSAAPYWPGAVSVEMATDSLPDYLRRSQAHMAARVPHHHELVELLRHTGPLMTTSANAPGMPTATGIRQAIAYFGDKVDFYVDAGDLGEKPPSTIIGFDSSGEVIVHRQGAVKIVD
jgi:L-threonylcarbamoyladenylate synthase